MKPIRKTKFIPKNPDNPAKSGLSSKPVPNQAISSELSSKSKSGNTSTTSISAKEILAQVGLKYSKQRAAIIDLLATATKPLNAFEITKKLNEAVSKSPSDLHDPPNAKPTYWPSTVYRTLENLLQAGIISKLDLPGSEQAEYVFHGLTHDQHVAVCLSCQKTFPLPDCPLSNSTQSLTSLGFQVTGHRIEIYGHCQDCQTNGISQTCPCCGGEPKSEEGHAKA